MNYKSTLIYLIISTLYLLTLKLVWIILSVLQGLELTNITLETNLILGLSLSLLSILFGNKINLLIKNLGLSLIFTYIFYEINNVTPLWFYFGIFLIYFLFSLIGPKLYPFLYSLTMLYHQLEIILLSFHQHQKTHLYFF